MNLLIAIIGFGLILIGLFVMEEVDIKHRKLISAVLITVGIILLGVGLYEFQPLPVPES